MPSHTVQTDSLSEQANDCPCKYFSHDLHYLAICIGIMALFRLNRMIADCVVVVVVAIMALLD